MPSLFEKDISTLKGVGPKRAALFKKLGAPTVGDLLHLYPRAYEDWRDTVPIRSTRLNEVNIIKGTVLQRPVEQRIRGGMTLYKTTVTDGVDDMQLTFFNNRYVMNLLEAGGVYAFRGKVTGTFTRREMASPEFVPESRMQDMVPVYPQTEGLTSRIIAGAMREALRLLPETVNDPLPDALRLEYALCRLEYALKTIHFPNSPEALSTARRRLVFEELLVLQLGMMEIRRAGARENPYPIRDDHTAAFCALLPFALTGAQQRAIRDAMRDMQGAHPMNRLIQGDVGSGKTAVAAALCYNVIQNGLQAALMAPTEILATQHFESLSALLAPCGIRLALITGSMRQKARREALEGLKSGEIQLAVGTHALLSEGVEFNRLALVITDEQHRFGVGQRTALAKKGGFPHTLVMSATPIPRTLALMIYGDLDVSVLDELPPGRQPIETYLIDPAKRRRAFGYIQKHIDAGRQAYIVRRPAHRHSARPDEAEGKGRRDGRFLCRPHEAAALDDGRRGWRRRAERGDHDDRKRRALRPIAASPAPRARRARAAQIHLHPRHRRAESRNDRAAADVLPDDGRLQGRGRGPAAARPRRFLRRAPARPAEAENRRHAERHAGARRSAGLRARPAGARPGAARSRPARPKGRDTPPVRCKRRHRDAVAVKPHRVSRAWFAAHRRPRRFHKT